MLSYYDAVLYCFQQPLLLLLSDDDVRLARRIQRDVQHRGRDIASVIHQYTLFVKPSFDRYVAPSRR
jgi:uridine kinase